MPSPELAQFLMKQAADHYADLAILSNKVSGAYELGKIAAYTPNTELATRLVESLSQEELEKLAGIGGFGGVIRGLGRAAKGVQGRVSKLRGVFRSPSPVKVTTTRGAYRQPFRGSPQASLKPRPELAPSSMGPRPAPWTHRMSTPQSGRTTLVGGADIPAAPPPLVGTPAGGAAGIGRAAPGKVVPVPEQIPQQLARPAKLKKPEPLLSWRAKAGLGLGAAGMGATYLGGKGLGAAEAFLTPQAPGTAYQHGMGAPTPFMRPQMM